jgi:hypothetical protein
MLRVALHTLLLLSGVAGAAEPAALPEHLRDTGLYADGASPFSPQYPLWSDGASKRRWIHVPEGTSIDATQPDAWEFPRGTKLWKEFSHGGRIETRFIELGLDGTWRYASYVWTADGKDAVLAPAAGMRDLNIPSAPGARYSIPAQDDCRACHEGAPVPVLGFSALQLSADLRSLVAKGVLKNLAPGLLAHPPAIEAANSTERAALGYLHGNCGHCHNDDGPLAVLEMSLSQRVGAKGPAGGVLRSLAGAPSQFRIAGATTRVAPGQPEASVLALRMRSREPLQQMPPLGTSVVDLEAMSLIGRWIESLSVHQTHQ